MMNLTTGKMFLAWCRIKEWKRWFLFWIPIAGLYFATQAFYLQATVPISYMKGAPYIVMLPALITFFALHCGIALFLPRGKMIASIILCFMAILGLIIASQIEGRDIAVAIYFVFANIFAYAITRYYYKKGYAALIRFFGIIIIVTAYAVILPSAILAFGFAWDFVEHIVGWGVWLIFWFTFPFALLLGPLYEIFSHENTEPAIFTWLMPLLGMLIAAAGEWIKNGAMDAEAFEEEVIREQ